MTTAPEFDVIVIGGGPGGYVAAIRAAQLGFRTACVDQWKNAGGGPALGGTCTNIGCIPSKALLQSSEYYEHARHAFGEHGIEVEVMSLNLDRMLQRKNKVVKQNNDGILHLFKKNKIAFFHGCGWFDQADANGYAIRVGGVSGQVIRAKHIVIATGSNARELPGVPFDEKLILSNSGALAIDAVPKKLGVIGAGVVGLELGSVWRRLGAHVTILEALPVFLGPADRQIAKEAHKLFVKQGLAIALGVQILSVKSGGNDVSVEFLDDQGVAQVAQFDKLIVSIGRNPNTIGLNAEGAGLQLDQRGFVVVNAQCQTNLPNVWAIGDVVRGPMLAHKAEEEGVAVAERIAGQHTHVNFDTVPCVIYTSPEIAWVGKNEQQLKAQGREFNSGSFPFMANGRARALGDVSGMVKVLADAASDEVLGVHIIGPLASELIAEAVMAMEFRASSEDIARICHAHPSLSEATKEAALAVAKRALNY